MNRTQRFVSSIAGITLALILLHTATAVADELQERMKARLPEIVALKTKGVIGENHLGFLEFVGQQREGADIVAAENADRRQLYAAIAAKTGAAVEQVGQRAAIKWRNNLGPGEYFKTADGTWIQK